MIISILSLSLSSASPSHEATISSRLHGSMLVQAPVGYEMTCTASGELGAGVQPIFQADDGTDQNRFEIGRSSDGGIHYIIVSGGVTQSDRVLGQVQPGQQFDASATWSGSTVRYTFNQVVFYETGVAVPTTWTNARYSGSVASGAAPQGGSVSGSVSNYKLLTATATPFPAYIDSFNRPDTQPGSLGTAPDGAAYDVRGPFAHSFPLPPATQGQIQNKSFLSSVGASVVYASKKLSFTPHEISCLVQWDRSGKHHSVETGCMVVSSSPNLIDSMVHITFTTSVANLQKRINGGAFVTIGSLNVKLLDGALHRVAFSLNNSVGKLTVDSQTMNVTDADLATLSGPYVFWEIYSRDADSYPIRYYNATAN
jgi:hypothetical protein